MGSKPTNKVSTIDQLVDKLVSDAMSSTMMGPVVASDQVFLSAPVSMVEFACSSDYLGLKDDLFDKIKKLLALIDNPNIRRVYLVLGKGSGKSTLVEVVLLYGIYLWSCYRDPFKFFNLMKTAKPACVNVSTSKDQARDVIFEGCLNMVDASPWFRNRFTGYKNSIAFDSGITLFAGHGNASAWLGYMTFVGAMDEVEFLVDSSKRSQAAELYNALYGSLRTRFPNHYKLLCISSAKERFSFLMKRAQDVLKKGTPVIV